MLHANRLLIVDDESDFGALVKEIGKALGYETGYAPSVAQFQQLFLSFQPSVCVVDMVMPDKDGLALLEWLAKREECPRVIIVSGFNPYFLRLGNLLATSRGLKVEATLTKPVPLNVLRAAIGPPRQIDEHRITPLPDKLDEGDTSISTQTVPA